MNISSFDIREKLVGISVILLGLLFKKLCANITKTKSSVRTTELGLDEFMLIPSVTSRKNIDSSKGLLTGCLNRTIDRAPTMPRDKAMLPEIALVITKDMGGNKKHVNIKL